jgi:DNA-binding NarL/FixJ family response regulator
MAAGASNVDIAGALVISQHTAANHVRSTLTTTPTSNRTQAAITAIALGRIEAPSIAPG